MQKVETGDRCIRRKEQKLAHKIKEDQIPPVVDEWKLYQYGKIPEDWYKTRESRSTRTDRYWAKAFQLKTLTGTEMFPHLKKLIFSPLVMLLLKRVCQSSSRQLKQTILLTPESLNGIRQVKDAVFAEDGKSTSWISTRSLCHALEESTKDTERD